MNLDTDIASTQQAQAHAKQPWQTPEITLLSSDRTLGGKASTSLETFDPGYASNGPS